MIISRLLGGIFVAVGAIGIFLPVWPTTVFWIVAALLFAQSSPSAQAWIYRQPGFGPIVENFVERGCMTRKSKVAATLGMTVFGGTSLFITHDKPIVFLSLLLTLLIGISYVWTRPE